MNTSANLKRFIEAQENNYQDAVMEVRSGKKKTHWMWYIFPQISGLGSSEISKFYAIKDLQEAQLFLQHPILGQRLIDISKVLSEIKDKSAHEIFGSPDDLKLKSCMTLFSSLKNAHPIFQRIIDQFFDGNKDDKTLQIIS